MNILDTNGVDYILRKGITLQNEYFLAPDVIEEVEMTQLVQGLTLPSKILEITNNHFFDEAVYLNHYKETLNKYEGRSFYNMTGFGDVSIIATTHMLFDIFQMKKETQLFDPTEKIIVYTNDTKLTTKIKKEFSSKNIDIREVGTIL